MSVIFGKIKWVCAGAGKICLAAMFGLSVAASQASAVDVKVGGIAIVKPKYEGSSSYEVVGAPIIFPSLGDGSTGRVSFNGADDVRFRFFNAGAFEFGALGGYDFGRDEDDGDRLRGLGDLDGGVILGAYAGYRIGATLFDVSYHHIVSGDDGGYFLRFGATFEQRIIQSTKLKLRVGTTYADESYFQNYFGITGAQAAGSAAAGVNLGAFDADAGLKDVFIKASANIDLTDRWTLLAGAGYSRLIGDAADSPIVESENQFTGTIGLTYKFSFSGHRNEPSWK